MKNRIFIIWKNFFPSALISQVIVWNWESFEDKGWEIQVHMKSLLQGNDGTVTPSKNTSGLCNRALKQIPSPKGELLTSPFKKQ